MPVKAPTMRVINIYATKWRFSGDAPEGDQDLLVERLELAQLSPSYDFYRDQLPRLLMVHDVAPADLSFPKTPEGTPVDIEFERAGLFVFALPSDQVVVALVLRYHSEWLVDANKTKPTAALLERCIDAEVSIRDIGLADFTAELLEPLGVEPIESEKDKAVLLPERHQLVFLLRDGRRVRLNEAAINEIMYRDDPPYREEFSEIVEPKVLNQGSGEHRTRGLVTPYVSLLAGHEKFVEDSVFLSTVHSVGTASRFRQIWHEAYRQVQDFRRTKQKQAVGAQLRGDLEQLADNLGNLEFDLTFNVEFPVMRIEGFHSALYGAMDLQNQAKALSDMFTQLSASLQSEITAIDIRDRRRTERRQKWNSIAASLLSLIGVPIGFLVAFLGINATQVNDDLSMFHSKYTALYVLAMVFAIIPVILIMIPYLEDWFGTRPRWPIISWAVGTVASIAGPTLIYMAFFNHHHTDPSTVDFTSLILVTLGMISVVSGITVLTKSVSWLIRDSKLNAHPEPAK